jgi:nicotinic acid phosphoribosyltransferase
MTGSSGKSSGGKIHQYYACVTQRKYHTCKKKAVKKDYIEDLVVDSILSVLTDDYIDELAQKISELFAKSANKKSSSF